MKQTIDATDKKLGRIATEAASFLMGKNLTIFKRNLESKQDVEIINIDKILIDLKKITNKTYTSYSGYPGGLKKKTMEEIIQKDGKEEILRRAIKGMLPKNKLTPNLMKRLIINK